MTSEDKDKRRAVLVSDLTDEELAAISKAKVPDWVDTEIGYTPDQARAAQYIYDKTGIGGGEDPIGFLICSHQLMSDQRNELIYVLARERVERARGSIDAPGFDACVEAEVVNVRKQML